MTESEWNEKRIKLEQELVEAAKDLLAHSGGAASIRVPFSGGGFVHVSLFDSPEGE